MFVFFLSRPRKRAVSRSPDFAFRRRLPKPRALTIDQYGVSVKTAAPRCARGTPSSLRRAEACLAGPPRRRAPGYLSTASAAERPRGSVRTAAPGRSRAPAPESDTRPSPPRATPGPAPSGRSVWARGSGRPGRPPRPRKSIWENSGSLSGRCQFKLRREGYVEIARPIQAEGEACAKAPGQDNMVGLEPSWWFS